MNFKGTAIKISDSDIEAAAASINVPEAALRAVMSVETDGHGFDKSGRPEILFERHKFYQNLHGDQLQRAIDEGLAYKTWGEKPYPKTPDLRWEEFMKAVAIDETAAIKSVSWGLGQIMGSEFDEAKYNTPQAMVAAFCASEANQIKGMCNLIRNRSLDVSLRAFPDSDACAHFALKYNGTGYRKNHYDTKLADAYKRFAALHPTTNTSQQPAAPEAIAATVEVDDRAKRIMELQKELHDGGLDPGPIDGILGKRTVMAFQEAQKLTVDGIAGSETGPLLEVAIASMEIPS